MRTKFLFFLAALFMASAASPQTVSIIPQPSKITINEGEFILNNTCSLEYDKSNAELERIAGFFKEYVQGYFGLSLNGNGNAITFKLNKDLGLGKEGYKLGIDNKQISIVASNPAGIFYGMQSLKQLFPTKQGEKGISIPALEIQDEPRFGWRGNMLDVARHFFPVSFIKKYLDILAMYKINTFHWHLTEDQGWRIEIKKYPELTEISHWREETVVGHARDSKVYDGLGYGGFYTQDQVKEIVKYAAERYITVVPEIEMPGHTSAVLAAYPKLGCTGGPYKVQGMWGVHEEVFCAGNEETFSFLEGVLDEVCELFPSEYIHIGGDECPKNAWKECPKCQKRIKGEGLHDEHELQSYFIKRMEKYLDGKGRRLIGWDEILEGGLAPKATVMSWRGEKGGIEAAKQNHDVVMSPNSHMYFDHYQGKDREKQPLAIGGYLPLEKVYSYNPLPNDLTEEEKKHVIGAQSNLWTEYVPSTSHAEYMLLPRLCALSEVTWTELQNKDFKSFQEKMKKHYEILDMLGYNYYKQ